MNMKKSRHNAYIVSESAEIFAKAILGMFLDGKFEAVKQNFENGDNQLDIKKKSRIHAPEAKPRRRKHETEGNEIKATRTPGHHLRQGNTQHVHEPTRRRQP